MTRDLKGRGLTRQTSAETEKLRPRPRGSQTRWQENHGNLLIAFVGIVYVMGACILLYRQNRFVAPRFPESDLIAPPPEPEVIEVDGNDNDIVISVIGAANDLGAIKIAIYDSESNFNRSENAVALETLEINDGKAVWRVSANQLPRRMALAAYHDENGDQQLNRNRLGVPTERYGFSKNARGLTGPPSFEQSVMPRPPEGGTINLFIR